MGRQCYDYKMTMSLSCLPRVTPKELLILSPELQSFSVRELSLCPGHLGDATVADIFGEGAGQEKPGTFVPGV